MASRATGREIVQSGGKGTQGSNRTAVTESLAAMGQCHEMAEPMGSDGMSGCKGTMQWEIATGAVAVMHDDA